jgi:GDP-L-fucose synthase
MKVLVTGGSGLVGMGLRAQTTQSQDYEYTFLSSNVCDLRDTVACKKLFSNGNFDIVIHLASVVAGLYGNLSNNYCMLIDNLKINTNILECCEKYNVKRLINILSTCVFGNDLKYPLTSNQMYDKKPDSSNEGYSYSKRLLDTGSKLLTKCSDLEVVNLIPTNLYGFNDNFNLHNGHVMPSLIHKCFIAKKNLENKLCKSTDSFNGISIGNTSCKLIIKGTGTSLRQFVFVEDLGKIILHFVNCKLEKQFNQLIVGPPIKHEITIKELVNKIVKEFDFNGKVIFDEDFCNGQHKKTVDDSELLKYIPNFKFTPLDVGLKKTIKYFIENYNIVRK